MASATGHNPIYPSFGYPIWQTIFRRGAGKFVYVVARGFSLQHSGSCYRQPQKADGGFRSRLGSGCYCPESSWDGLTPKFSFQDDNRPGNYGALLR